MNMPSIRNASSPTLETYTGLERAYDHFNSLLFDGTLPDCLLTLQREKKTQGYYSPKRFISPATGEITDEIALNPDRFGQHPLMEAFQTLVHEMSHQWQFHFGNPGRARYHNKEWANKMLSIGLTPSSTGKHGGKMTGDHMSDYPTLDGAFIEQANLLTSRGYKLPWIDRLGLAKAINAGNVQGASIAEELIHLTETGLLESDILTPEEAQVQRTGRIKYVHNCDCEIINVWGRKSLNLACGNCGSIFEKEG